MAISSPDCSNASCPDSDVEQAPDTVASNAMPTDRDKVWIEKATARGNHATMQRFPKIMRGHFGTWNAERRAKSAWLPLLGCLAVAACKPPPKARYHFDSQAIERGKLAIERVGCAACHEIPGIAWPKGRIAPSLSGFDDVGVIAGSLPNTPANLAAFVRNAPEAKPGSTMPPMPLTEDEARDVAAYLLGMDDA